MGLRFIGVVKTATKKFPMSYLSNLELVQHGDYKGLVARGTDGQPTMLSFVWMDRECHYFIASASSLDSGILYSRNRWRQVSLELDALPENMELTIPQPKATEVYYRTCGVIDQHNRHCQDNLKTKKKLETKKWDMRVNLTIFSMIVVDTWLVYSQATGSTELQSEFYVRLAEELIDSNIDSQLQRRRNSGEDGSDSNDESPVMTRTGRVCTGISYPQNIAVTPGMENSLCKGFKVIVLSVVRRQLTFVLLAWIRTMSQKHHGCVTLKNDQHASPTTISTLI